MDRFVKTLSPAFRMDDLIFDVNLYRLENPCIVTEHGHSYVELILCTAGACEHLVNGVEGIAEAGDLIAMHPGWTHELRITRPFEHITIAFTKAAPAHVAPELKDHDGFKQLFMPEDSKSATLRLSPGGYHEVKSLTDAMLEEYAGKRPGWQTFMRANFSLLVASLSRMKIEGDGKEGLARLNGVVSYIESNFRKPLKLGELARMAGLSESQLHRLFKKTYGTSPIDYLIKTRIAEVKRLLLLRGRGISISELASASGFADGNYLCRVFKNAMGVSPHKYNELA